MSERCPRCDAQVKEERYCLECRLDRFPQRPRLPTVDAHDAAARARAWRAQHPGHADPGSGEILVTTCERLIGYEVLDEIGMVHGVVVRSRSIFTSIGADLQSLVGGELSGFTQLLDEARTMAGEIGDKAALTDVLSRTGEVKAAMGRGPEAVRDLTEAKGLASGLGDRVALAVTHQRLAQVQLQLGNLAAADVEAAAAVAVSEAVGLRAHIGCGYRVKAEVADALGNAAGAEEDFRRAIDILSAVKHEVELARAYQGLAGLKDRIGQRAEGQKLRGRAADIFARLRGAAATD